jgi:dienelactone hydrolase
MEKKDRAFIVLHEIYGVNDHMKRICRQLESQGFDVICPNLIERDLPFSYKEGKIAYQHFTGNIGFEKASEQVINLIVELKRTYKQVVMMGYSIGATIAWICSTEVMIDGVVGFYGSRIRDYLNIQPKCPVLLFYPEKEVSFSVDELMNQLKRENVEVYQLAGRHGFADKDSLNYHKESEKAASLKVIDFWRGL